MNAMEKNEHFKHIGAYGYTAKFLSEYSRIHLAFQYHNFASFYNTHFSFSFCTSSYNKINAVLRTDTAFISVSIFSEEL